MSFLSSPATVSGEPTRWVSLGRACRMLGVNESTLRRWADEGQVQSYRTPGGHRRFSENDLIALMNETHRRSTARYGGLGDLTISRIRRHLHRGKGADESWYQQTTDDENERERLRDLGRRLVELVPEYLSRRGHTRAQEAATAIGQQYGQELRRIGLTSREAVQAFTFFRKELASAARQFAIREGLTFEEAENASEQINALADIVLLALLEPYENPGLRNK